MNVSGHRRLGRTMVAVVATAALGLGMAGHASAGPGDNEHFIVHFVGADNLPGRVVAVGPIHGIGTAVDSDYQAGPSDTFTAKTTLSFPGATIVVRIQGTQSDSFDPMTCVGSFTAEGRFTILDGPPGTTGSGRFTNRGKFFAPRTDQGCADEGGTEVVVRHMVGAVQAPAL